MMTISVNRWLMQEGDILIHSLNTTIDTPLTIKKQAWIFNHQSFKLDYFLNPFLPCHHLIEHMTAQAYK